MEYEKQKEDLEKCYNKNFKCFSLKRKNIQKFDFRIKKQIEKLTFVWSVDLSCNQLDSLINFPILKNLKILNLNNNNINDDAIVKLKGISSL